MLVKELIEILQQMPPDMPVMLPAEAGVDQPQSVYIAKVAKTRRNWSGTPVGNFRVLNEHMSEEIDGDAFDAAIIDLNEVYKMALRTVLFCSQKEAQARPAWPGWAVISVTSAIASPTDLQEGWTHVLRLAFDDIDVPEEPYVLFSEQQARSVIEFAAMCHGEKIEGILVHCAAGISRSAAIAKWIADRYQLPFNDQYMLYNKHVHTTLREERMLEGI